MRSLSSLYQPNSNNYSVSKNISLLSSFMCEVFCFADELGFHLLCALDLQVGTRNTR